MLVLIDTNSILDMLEKREGVPEFLCKFFRKSYKSSILRMLTGRF